MRKVRILLGALIIAVLPAAGQALPPVGDVLRKMKEAFEPARPSLRTLAITVHNMGEDTKLIVQQARKQTADGKRMVMVLAEPEGLRGSADLIAEAKQAMQPPVMWIYEPFIRRVRKLITIDGYEHFLGTDFTYADLGFVRLHKNHRLIGVEQKDGTTAYKVEEKLPAGQIYYSRVVMWVAQSTMLPLERDYYDPAGDFWKKEVFDSVSTVDGVPTVLHVQMADLLSKTSTDLNVTQIKYDVAIPDTLFDPDHLPKLLDDPVWQAGGATP